MRVLLVHAHPVETSFNAALAQEIRRALARAGHQIDDCDLYAEGFDPVLSREERLRYHDVPANRQGVENHVERLLAADGIVLSYPVWNFGMPAILKGYLDRVWLPGVAFRLEKGRVVRNLQRLRHLAAVTTYGARRWEAALAGNPPRRLVTRMLRNYAQHPPRLHYLALYDMDRIGADRRQRFLRKVGQAMERF